MSIDLIFSFLKENYRFIIDVIAFIIVIILFFVRKKPVNSLFSVIFSAAYGAVNAAELSGLKKQEKLDFAINIVKDELIKTYPDLDVNRYIATITYVIEVMLDTPKASKNKK